ncbi:MAG: acyltransferase family protein [Acidimicrobiales bacterium]
MAASRTKHLSSVDLLRSWTVVGVLAVHTISNTTTGSDRSAGALLELLHVTRSVFLALSGFVLAYSLAARPLATWAFWRRRYPLVLAPYLVWTALYLLNDYDPSHYGSAGKMLWRYVVDLADGGARYHLYFLLLTLQLYLIMPWLYRWLERQRRHHLALLAAAAVFQLAFTAAIHYGWRPPVLSVWLNHPGSWLPSYPLYVIGGVLAAMHFEEVTDWVTSHRRLIAWSVLGAAALGVLSYASDLTWLSMGPIKASQVFQPSVVIESVAFTAGLYALGIAVAGRLRARGRRRAESSADVSFGVYLAHPMLLQGLIAASAATGLSGALSGLPSGVILPMVLGLLVPTLCLASWGGVAVIRRTPLSVWLTGRPRQVSPPPDDPLLPGPPRLLGTAPARGALPLGSPLRVKE